MLSYVTATVQLADKRVLVHKNLFPGSTKQSTVTMEKLITDADEVTPAITSFLWESFGISTIQHPGVFAEVTKLEPFNYASYRCVMPFVVRLKSALAFKASRHDMYNAYNWQHIVNDVFENSLAWRVGEFPKHSPTSIRLVQVFNQRGIFA